MNLETSDGRAILQELAAGAEIVIESFEPGYLAGHGLDYEALAAQSPRLVMLSITPFGQTGPNANLPATELTLFAACGQLWLTGDPARTPLKNGGSQPSYQAGLNGFAAVTGAYYGALKHGMGTQIDLAMQETYAAMAEAFMNRASQLGVDTMRSGNNLNALWGIYPTADGYGGLCALPRNFAGVLEAVDMEELRAARFAEPAGRLENNDELIALMYGWFAQRTREDLVELGLKHRVPFGFVASIRDLAESEHLQERGYFIEQDHPKAGALTFPGRLWQSDAYDWRSERAPELGEHNVAVLHEELGYELEDLVRLRELDAI